MLIIGERINDYILVIFQIPHPKMKGQVGFDHEVSSCFINELLSRPACSQRFASLC